MTERTGLKRLLHSFGNHEKPIREWERAPVARTLLGELDRGLSVIPDWYRALNERNLLNDAHLKRSDEPLHIMTTFGKYEVHRKNSTADGETVEEAVITHFPLDKDGEIDYSDRRTLLVNLSTPSTNNHPTGSFFHGIYLPTPNAVGNFELHKSKPTAEESALVPNSKATLTAVRNNFPEIFKQRGEQLSQAEISALAERLMKRIVKAQFTEREEGDFTGYLTHRNPHNGNLHRVISKYRTVEDGGIRFQLKFEEDTGPKISPSQKLTIKLADKNSSRKSEDTYTPTGMVTIIGNSELSDYNAYSFPNIIDDQPNCQNLDSFRALESLLEPILPKPDGKAAFELQEKFLKTLAESWLSNAGLQRMAHDYTMPSGNPENPSATVTVKIDDETTMIVQVNVQENGLANKLDIPLMRTLKVLIMSKEEDADIADNTFVTIESGFVVRAQTEGIDSYADSGLRAFEGSNSIELNDYDPEVFETAWKILANRLGWIPIKLGDSSVDQTKEVAEGTPPLNGHYDHDDYFVIGQSGSGEPPQEIPVR